MALPAVSDLFLIGALVIGQVYEPALENESPVWEQGGPTKQLSR